MATSCPSELDVDALRERIRDVYTRVAEDPSGDFHFHRGARYAVDVLGYDADELSALPRRTTDRFAGVGNPLAWAALEPGMTVLDHACGAGMDVLIAARRVGPEGRVIGVDMTPLMRQAALLSAREAGLADRVDIRAGMFEDLPVASASVDVVLSNGVLNLAPDKRRVLSEVRRVLRPGGLLCLSDVVVQRELSLRARSEAELWAACVGGALVESELSSLAAEMGFVHGEVRARFASFAGSSAEARVSGDLRLGAVTFTARRAL
ncbi:MAG: arsenite S-adenosylmethyltransferase [Polyangiaceae bacterium]